MRRRRCSLVFQEGRGRCRRRRRHGDASRGRRRRRRGGRERRRLEQHRGPCSLSLSLDPKFQVRRKPAFAPVSEMILKIFRPPPPSVNGKKLPSFHPFSSPDRGGRDVDAPPILLSSSSDWSLALHPPPPPPQ